MILYEGHMRRFLGYVTGTVAFAVGSAFVVFVVWNRLVRAEIVSNSTLEWFTTVAVIWACLCIGGGALVYRRSKAD